MLKGGAGLSTMDSVLIYEVLGYGCTGVAIAIVANDLAVGSMCLCLCVLCACVSMCCTYTFVYAHGIA